MMSVFWQVPKEKRLLQIPKVAEVTEEQEKRSGNLEMHRKEP